MNIYSKKIYSKNISISNYLYKSFLFTFRPISNWEGIPDDVDDAIQYDNGFTYFFKKGDYYRFNDRYFRVGSSDSSYKSQN